MKKRNFILLVAALIVIIAGFVAWYFFIPKASWNTYQNSNGYSFRYPNAWEIWDASNPDNITLGQKDGHGIIMVSAEYKDLSQLVGFINKDERDIKVTDQKSINFAGIPSTELTLTPSPYNVIFIPIDSNKGYSVWHNELKLDQGFDEFDNAGLVKTEDQILSTFRFEK